MNKHVKCLCWCLDPRFWCRAALHTRKNRGLLLGLSLHRALYRSCRLRNRWKQRLQLFLRPLGWNLWETALDFLASHLHHRRIHCSPQSVSKSCLVCYPQVSPAVSFCSSHFLIAGARTYIPDHQGLNIIWELIFIYKITDKKKHNISIKVDMTWGYVTNVLNY